MTICHDESLLFTVRSVRDFKNGRIPCTIAIIIGEVAMSTAGEFFGRVFKIMLEPGYYAERRERRRKQNDAFMHMMEKKLESDRKKGPFRHFVTVGNRLRRNAAKVVHQ